MNQLDNFKKNSLISVSYQLVSMFFAFLTRFYFLKYFGIELLGINSSLVALLNTLSLAELGFQTAITFHLYKPLEENNKSKINKIMNIFRIVYYCIGIFIFAAGLCLMPALGYILKGIVVKIDIYIYYILNLISIVVSYFFSYKRTLFFADKNDFVSKNIDMIITIIFNLLKIISIVYFKNFIYYLILGILQNIIANIIINIISLRYYPFLKREKIDKGYFKEIIVDVKDVMFGKISNYIYSSTDNLIISSFIGTIYVGYYVNYMTIISQIKNMLVVGFNPILPILGRMDGDKNKKKELFNLLTFVRYLLSLTIVVPTAIIISDFIALWLGEQYIIPFGLVILIISDFYMSFMSAPCYEFIRSAGLFKQEKRVLVIGTLFNLFFSILFTLFWGIGGVLLGTVIAQAYMWFFLSRIVNYDSLQLNKKDFQMYWSEQIKYIIYFFIASLTCYLLKIIFLSDKSYFINFILGGVLCEFIVLLFIVVVFHNNMYFKKVFKIIRRK